MPTKLTTEEFIEKAKTKRTDVDFDYSKVQYLGSNTKVLIIDPEYGEFSITPKDFLNGRGHPLRAGNMKLSTEEFIKKAKTKRTDVDFDYSKVNYINTKTKVLIIDPEFGEFWQTPECHLRGQHHPVRGRKIRDKSVSMNTNEFIVKAREVHGNMYDYSKVEYINTTTKITIIDPVYGEFFQMPISHLAGHGSPLRSANLTSLRMKSNRNDFITKANEVHGNMYDYSKVDYIGAHTKVLIIDPEFGEFWQTPSSHLNGRGNPSRAGRGNKTTQIFINESIKVHGNLYDYSKVEYKNQHTDVIIIDPEFGEFLQSPSNHLAGKGNMKRAGLLRGNNLRSSVDEFIQKAREVHGDLYDYSKVEYITCDTKVIIIDPEFGEFEQSPYNHVKGSGNPLRAGHNQKYSYISLVLDNFNPIGIKYGIESTKGKRTISQNRQSVYDIVRIKTFEFRTPEECKAAEIECKKIFQKENRKLYNRNGFISKQDMKDGWSETTIIQNTDKIIEIYKKYNAVEVDNNTLEESK